MHHSQPVPSQLKYGDPITTDIPAAVVPMVNMCCTAQVMNVQSPEVDNLQSTKITHYHISQQLSNV